MNEEFEREEQERSTLKVTEFVTVSELATMMNVSPTCVITACMNLGLMVSINQRLDASARRPPRSSAKSNSFGRDSGGHQRRRRRQGGRPRAAPPIVTVMGHVDHGKTSLLDNIRKPTSSKARPRYHAAHIGAYSVEPQRPEDHVLDTPGHEAFTAMRARGAAVPTLRSSSWRPTTASCRTIEAINHAQAAGVPMVFAINKTTSPTPTPTTSRSSSRR